MPHRYIFIEFNTPEEADRARMTMDKHPFDARHRFQINVLSDIETFKDMDETYEDPKPEEFKPLVGSFPLLLGSFYAIMCVAIWCLQSIQEHLRAWLADPQGRDQYVLFHRDDVTIYWHGKPAATEVVAERQVSRRLLSQVDNI